MDSIDNGTKLDGSTRIFKMPSSDSTVPDLLASSEPKRPTLTIVKGPHVGESFVMDSDVISLGRDPSNSVFLNDMTVSRRHAQIDVSNLSEGMATINDLGSLNGTWVDGAIVTQATIKDGSTIQIGTFRMIFHTNDASSAEKEG